MNKFFGRNLHTSSLGQVTPAIPIHVHGTRQDDPTTDDDGSVACVLGGQLKVCSISLVDDRACKPIKDLTQICKGL